MQATRFPDQAGLLFDLLQLVPIFVLLVRDQLQLERMPL